jgi:hypothetical protein
MTEGSSLPPSRRRAKKPGERWRNTGSLPASIPEERHGDAVAKYLGLPSRTMYDTIRLLLTMSAPDIPMVELQAYHTIRLWLVMLTLHVPVYFVWGRVLFRSWESFWEAIVFWIKPDFWSWLDDEYWDDVWAEAKLALWFFAPIGLIALEIRLLRW